jgi:cyclopropane fatty-acyl-phospholipid synthase-like methyltransferase
MLNTTQENFTLYSEPENAPALDEDRANLIKNWLQHLTNVSRSLDIGCGNSGFSKLLPANVETWGLDFDRHPDLPPQFQFISGDISQDWQVPMAYFDLIFGGEVIEHVLDTDLFLTRCFNTLNSGGYLILTTPNLSSFANLRYWLQTDQYMWVDSGSNQMGHVRYLAPKTMEIALQKAGFSEIKMQSVAGLEGLNFFPPLRKLIQNMFPLRGNRLCSMARKP